MTDVNHLYVDLGKKIINDGNEVKTRGTISRELLANQHVMDLNKPLIVTLSDRNLNVNYVKSEYEWYNSGSLSASDIGASAPFWLTLQDQNGEVVSNYGYWIYHDKDSEGKTRFDRCVEHLVADKETRKAIINIHDPLNSIKNPKDTPCTIALQFLIRDNRLHMIVTMRSNDLVIGWCNDIIQFQLIALSVYHALKFSYGMDIKLGLYYHQAGSLHIYDRHYGRQEWSKDKFDVRDENVMLRNKMELLIFLMTNTVPTHSTLSPTEFFRSKSIQLFTSLFRDSEECYDDKHGVGVPGDTTHRDAATSFLRRL